MKHILRLYISKGYKTFKDFEQHDIELKGELETHIQVSSEDDLIIHYFNPDKKDKRSSLRWKYKSKEVHFFCPSDQKDNETIYRFFLCTWLEKDDFGLAKIGTEIFSKLTDIEKQNFFLSVEEFVKEKQW